MAFMSRLGSVPRLSAVPRLAFVSRLVSRRTVRFRLAMLSSALFLVAGAGLLAITYGLMSGSSLIGIIRRKDGTTVAIDGLGTASGRRMARLASPGVGGHGSPTPAQSQIAHQLYTHELAQRSNDLHQLLIQSGVALAIMAICAVALGWMLAGRMLRPLRLMKDSAQRISERNLHERLSLPGPADEVKDLADTIDGLLGRLEKAFAAQRRFVASASHELRTPLTLSRALLEVTLADPAAGAGELRDTCRELLAAGEHQERLIEGLLTLATSERGIDRREELDLADIARRALLTHRPQAERRGLTVLSDLGRAPVLGDPDLAERLAANLIDNAIRYNVPAGTVSAEAGAAGTGAEAGMVEVTTGLSRGHAVLTVTNTGPVVPDEAAEQIFQPFQRLSDGRPGHADGHGLGLSIVRAIADAHDARLEVDPRPLGGLTVTTHFPLPPGPPPPESPARDRHVPHPVP